jgi:hypothetical protein
MALVRVRPVQQFVLVSCLFVTRATRVARRMLASICAGWAVVARPATASATSAEEQLAEKYAHRGVATDRNAAVELAKEIGERNPGRL